MKKIFLTTIFCMAAFVSINAQTSIRTEMRAYLEQNGYTISKEIYADLKEGGSAYHWKTFYSGTSYVIIAYSEDYGVQDIDIYLYDNDGKSLLVRDTERDLFAIVTYEPYVTREMKVVIKNFDSVSSYRKYNCKFIIAYSN